MTDETPTRVGSPRAHHGGPDDGAPDNGAPDGRVAPLAASLAARLRPVCQDWDATTFDALVERIARTKLRWADLGYSE